MVSVKGLNVYMSNVELLDLLKTTMDESECDLATGIKSIEIDKKAEKITFCLEKSGTALSANE
jgi:hypothetical protein